MIPCFLALRVKKDGKREGLLRAINTFFSGFPEAVCSGNDISMRKDVETMNKNKSEMNKVISNTNNTLEGSESRLDEVDDQISHLKDKVEKTNTQLDQQEEKKN